MKNQRGGALISLIFTLVFLGGWLTHVVMCIKAATWGFLIAGAIFFPIGIVHGLGFWVGAW